MRVGFLVNRFPKVSETFVINAVRAAMLAGEEAVVFARRTGIPGELQQPGIAELGLLQRTRYLNMPVSKFERVLRVPSLLRGARDRAPLVRALDVLHYRRRALNLSLLYAAAGVLSRPEVDILHVQFGTLVPLMVALRRIGAVPETTRLVVSIRGADISRYLRRNPAMYDGAMDMVDRWLPVSRYFADRLVALGAPPQRVEVLHSGIHVAATPYRAPVRADREVPHVVMVGRLVEKKGFGPTLEALARVAGSGVEFRVSLVGDGPLRGELEESCERLGLSGQVTFLGARTQEEVMALLAQAHLFAAPSVTGRDGDEEGIPTTLMEAMAVGLPVVATRHAGIPELVEDGVCGLLVGERDVDALAGALRTLLADPRRGVEMGAAGRARVASRFDAAVTDARTVDLYRELIYGPGLERLTLAS